LSDGFLSCARNRSPLSICAIHVSPATSARAGLASYARSSSFCRASSGYTRSRIAGLSVLLMSIPAASSAWSNTSPLLSITLIRPAYCGSNSAFHERGASTFSLS
jgi:hypothetical protein